MMDDELTVSDERVTNEDYVNRGAARYAQGLGRSHRSRMSAL
jgi:hypothetical protein